MAFVFLNHYLDIHDAMEEGVTSTEMLDNSDIKNTDIPLNVTIPARTCIPEDAHDEVKEWVLAASMDRSIAQVNAIETSTVTGIQISLMCHFLP